jgi:hypothetical protein
MLLVVELAKLFEPSRCQKRRKKSNIQKRNHDFSRWAFPKDLTHRFTPRCSESAGSLAPSARGFHQPSALSRE